MLLTIPEVATALRINRSSVYRLFDGGELRWVRVGSTRRVSSVEINRFILAALMFWAGRSTLMTTAL